MTGTLNKKIFVDTGAWFAIADKNDQFHIEPVGEIQKS
jgi:predicted nucleic acid-binding protein